MEDKRVYPRNMVDIISFPLKVNFTINNEVYFTGKVWDISKYGLSIMSNNNIKEVNCGNSGILRIWKVEQFIDITSICMWKEISLSSLFYGFSTNMNLYNTELKNYLT